MELLLEQQIVEKVQKYGYIFKLFWFKRSKKCRQRVREDKKKSGKSQGILCLKFGRHHGGLSPNPQASRSQNVSKLQVVFLTRYQKMSCNSVCRY